MKKIKSKKLSQLPVECLEEVRTFKSKTGGYITFCGETKGFGLTPRESIDDYGKHVITYEFHQPYFEKYKKRKKSNT